jgi:DNA-binding transcriptional LysR family regulator
MKITQARHFLAICQERNFTRAARRCGITQPTITNSIRALEGKLGGALFQRYPVVELTARGQALYPYLRRIVEAVDLALLAAGNGPVRSSKPTTLQEAPSNSAAKAVTLNVAEQFERPKGAQARAAKATP